MENRRWVIWLVLFVLAGALASCGGRRSGRSGPTPGIDGGASACGVCPAGTRCDSEIGCVSDRACARDSDCVDDEPCTASERCDDRSRTCVYRILDGDGDGEPPRVCGGNDCDDDDPYVGIGEEWCDGYDNDCDGLVDESADDDCGEGQSCRDGRCQCDRAGEQVCSGTCVDVSSDPEHCGRCYEPCGEGTCVDGSCRCPGGLTYCGYDGCVDTSTDPTNCGACDVLCDTPMCTGGRCDSCGGVGEACCGGTCSAGAVCSGGSCVACGAVGQPCCAGDACTSGGCIDGTCTALQCEEPYPALPSGALPRCSSATQTCLDGCTTSSCVTSCLDADTTAAYMGVDCRLCVGRQMIYCGDRSGCSAEREAWECCVEIHCPAGSPSTCADAMCSSEEGAFLDCLDTTSCTLISSSYIQQCFP